MRPLKPALTYDEQVERLKSEHGLTITDKDAAIEILSRVNYYRLSAYGIGLHRKDDQEKFIAGITLEHLYQLYRFDSILRSIINPVIEYIEIEFKTKLAYRLAINYGPEGYTNSVFFQKIPTKDNADVYESTIEKFKAEVNRQKDLPCVKHHIEVYGGHFPIWAAIELFSFGMASSLYRTCCVADQKKIADEYRTDPKHLNSWLVSLLELRNKCAHYNRIYNMPFKKTPILYSEYHNYTGNKLFPILLIMRRMVYDQKDLWKGFYERLLEAINNCPEVRIGFMDFPENWKDLLK